MVVSLPLPGVVLGTVALTTGLRYYLNVRFCGARLFRQPAKDERENKRACLLEECWLFVMSNILLALSTWAIVRHNKACTFVNTADCFTNWKQQSHEPEQQFVYSLSLGWYLHGIVKSAVPGIGLHAGADMVAHHFITVATLAASYVFALERMGLLLLGLLNISNPFMHFAKMLHYGGFAQYKTAAFATFGAAFFVSRLIMFPVLIYGVGIRAMLDHWEESSFGPGMVCLALVTFLQALQVYWFARIVRLLVNAKKPPTEPTTASNAAAPLEQTRDASSVGKAAIDDRVESGTGESLPFTFADGRRRAGTACEAVHESDNGSDRSGSSMFGGSSCRGGNHDSAYEDDSDGPSLRRDKAVLAAPANMTQELQAERKKDI